MIMATESICLRILVSLTTIIFIALFVIEFMNYFHPMIMFTFQIINIGVPNIILFASLINQRKHFKLIKSEGGTVQSQTTNIMLLFMGMMYWGCLSSLIFINTELWMESVLATMHLFGTSLLVGAHFIGGLQWAKITRDAEYDPFSINWCCRVYLICSSFRDLIAITLYPWFNFEEWLNVQNTLITVSGILCYVCVVSYIYWC